MLCNDVSTQNPNRIGIVAANHTGYVTAMMTVMETGKVGVPLRDANDYDRINAAYVEQIITPTAGEAWMTGDFKFPADDSLALISFTSGTESSPKGVLLTHNNLANVVKRLNTLMELDENIREYIGVPVYHSFGFGRCRAVAAAHGKFFIPENGFNPSEIGIMLKKGEINAISAVPSLWRVLLANKDLIGSFGKRVRWIEIGSQYMSRQEKEELKLLFPEARILQHYGLTEASRTTLLEIHQEEGDVLESVGRAIGGVAIKLTEDGRIAIQGEHVASKYLINGKEEKIRDDEGWFITNDLGDIENGYLYYKGRADDIINCGGIKVSPDMLEAKIYARIGYSDSLAVCRKADPLRGEGFLIAMTKEVKVDKPSLLEVVLQATREFGINASNAISITDIDSLPKTASGKVQRRKLSEWYALQEHNGENVGTQLDESYRQTNSYVPPKTELEHQLVLIWQEILGIPKVGVNDHFFELGNDSLLAVQVIARIQSALQVELSLRQMFEAPTIAEMALSITQSKLAGCGTQTPWHSLVPIQPHGTRPPLFGIHISYFRGLAKYLGSEQPIYALRYGLAAKSLETNPPLPSSVEALAAHYVEEMRQFQPEGPYYLMGLSFGGTIAFEMARQLLSQGQTVALLVLFDTQLPIRLQPIILQEQLANYLKVGFSGIGQRVWERVKHWFKKQDTSQIYTYNPVEHCPLGEQHFFQAYTPQPYYGKVAFFKSILVPEELSSIRYRIEAREQVARRLSIGDFEVYEIPSDHIALLEEPYVQELAKHLKACIDRTLRNCSAKG